VRYIRRGEIYTVDLSPVAGSEQGGVRPVLIIQNDVGNKYSPTTIVSVITAKNKAKFPTHIQLGRAFGLPKESTILLEQIRTIDKIRLREKIGEIDDKDVLGQIDRAIHVSLGLM